MKELKKTKRITISGIVIAVVILIGILTMKKPDFSYKTTPEKMVLALFEIAPVSPDEAMEFLSDTSVVFIDIRSIYDFELGHLGDAINIPVPNLLDKENKVLFNQWFKDSTLVVFYGNDEAQATQPWMMMYQLGYTNTRVLMGGCIYMDKFYDDELTDNDSYSTEDPMFDYAGIIKKASVGEKNPQSANKPEKKKVVVRKKKKKEAEGGC